MNEFRDNAARDDSLAQELLTPISIAAVGLALTLLLLVLVLATDYALAGITLAGIFPIALLVAAHSANRARQRGWRQLA